MKKDLLFASVLFVYCFLFSCKKDFTEQVGRITSNDVANYTATTKGMSYGVLINAAHRYSTDTYTDSLFVLVDTSKISLARTYGVKYYRLSITHDSEWTIPSRQASFLVTYREFYDSGFSILLNVKYKNPGVTPISFSDSAAYRSFLAQVLDSIGSRKPAGVYVENEETNTAYFSIADTTDFLKYIKVLGGAVAECHSRSITATKGGMTSGILIPLTWDWLVSRHMGDTALTNGFARKAFGPTRAGQLINGSLNSLIALFKPMMSRYVATGIDNINMHWYEPVILETWSDATDGSSAGVNLNTTVPGVFDSVTTYINSKFTVPVLTNEAGQLSSSSVLTDSMMYRFQRYQSGGSSYPVVCWYDGDGPDEYTAYALHNAYKTLVSTPRPAHYVYTFSLRGTGTAFKTDLQ